MSIPELLSWWRAHLNAALWPLDLRDRLPWMGNTMNVRSFATARLMEAWSHGLDPVDVAGVEPVDIDRLRNIAHIGYATREFACRNRGLAPNPQPLRVELLVPSGAIGTWGPEDAANQITGSASDFCGSSRSASIIWTRVSITRMVRPRSFCRLLRRSPDHPAPGTCRALGLGAS